MANVKISDLPAASTPLTGTELVPIVQSGVTSQTTVGGLLSGPNGSNLVGFLQSGTGAVATTVQTKLRETVSVKDFGAVGDGVTDDTAEIQAAIDAVNAAGGGSILFPQGTYKLSTAPKSATIYDIDLTNPSGVTSSTVQVQLLAQGLHDTRLIFDGAILQSSITNGGITLCFDGCYNVSIENIKMIGSTQLNTSTGAVVTTGTNGVAILSNYSASSNINLHNPAIYNHYSGIYINGNPTGLNRVKGVAISGYSSVRHAYYGLALHNNGDDVEVENLYTYENNRPFFIYGVNNFDLSVVGDTMLNGYQAIIKAYSRNTTGGNVKFFAKNRTNTQAKLNFSSQHNPTYQATPAYIDGINIEYYEDNVVAGTTILFDYYQNSTSTSTSANRLFNNFNIVGKTAGDISTSVVLTNVSNPCIIDISKFEVGSGLVSFLESSGFYNTKLNTYIPVLSFGGGSTGITYTTQYGEYYFSDGLCYASFDITLSNKGSSTGAAIITLPIKVRKDSGTNFVQGPVIVQNGSGIPASVFGYLVPTLNEYRLSVQGSTSDTSLTNISVTNTTRFFGTVIYPY